MKVGFSLFILLRRSQARVLIPKIDDNGLIFDFKNRIDLCGFTLFLSTRNFEFISFGDLGTLL